MSNFDQAVEVVFGNEGGLSDHPADPGGVTKYGITLPVLRDDGVFGDIDGDGDVDGDDVRVLTLDQARSIYNRQWWLRYKYGQIENQWIATKVFDMSVLLGPSRAHKMAQWALGSVGRPVKVDGILGPVSFGALNGCADKLALLASMRSEAAGMFRLAVAANPGLGVFLAGWIKRAYQ